MRFGLPAGQTITTNGLTLILRGGLTSALRI